MANKTITIVWNGGSPKFSPPPGKTELRFGDVVTLQLTGAPSGASIDEVTIFADKDDAKGHRLCGWQRSRPNVCPMYSIAADSETVVEITDIERPAHDKKYWFSAAGQGPDVPHWEVDPELINKPDGGG